MKCPACGNQEDKVLESRTLQDFEITRRRRECIGCGYRFTTHERIEEQPLMVIKSDKTRELFNPAKIEKGLIRAFVKRPFQPSDISKIVADIERDLRDQRVFEIESEDIGRLVMGKLKNVDPVAYIRFVSVYRKFEDAQEFMNEVQQILTPAYRPQTSTQTSANPQ